MPIKLKAGEAVDALNALDTLDSMVSLGTALGWRVARIRRELEPEVKMLGEKRVDIVVEHGVLKDSKDQKSERRLIPGTDGYAKGRTAIRELDAQEITLASVDPIPLSKLIDRVNEQTEEQEDDDEAPEPVRDLGKVLAGLMPLLNVDTELELATENRAGRRRRTRDA